MGRNGLKYDNIMGKSVLFAKFCGTVSSNSVFSSLLTDYYDLAEVKWKFDLGKFLSPTLETEVCDSPDEDPMDKCLPVDCIIKYSGSRSYFDLKSRLCVKVPLCESNSNTDLPTVVSICYSILC